MSDPKKQDKQPAPEVQPQVQARVDDTAAIAGAVAQKTLEAVLPSLLAGLKAGQAPAPVQSRTHIPRESKRTCGVCGWVLADQKSATGECEKHEEVVVFPTFEECIPHFLTHGIKVGGVKFMSQNASDRIKVPVGMASTLTHMVQEYERGEREMRLGRTKLRRGASAVISPAGQHSNPIPGHAANGWE